MEIKAAKNKGNGVFRRMPEDDVDYVTDIRTSVLVQTPRGGRAILWATLALFVIFIGWAAVSEVEQTTRGEGKVIPASQVQVIQNLEGGILSELHVKVGDTVKKGQLLLKIDETRFVSSLEQSQAKSGADKAKAARLRAEAAGSGSFSMPSDVPASIAASERALFESRRSELKHSLEVKQSQIDQRQSELRELNTRLRELNQTYTLYVKEINITKPLVAKGAVSDMELLQLERKASEMKGEIETIKQSIPRTQAKIDESYAAMKELRLNFANKAKAEYNDTVAKVGEETASSLALKDRLDRTLVRSPVNGTVNRILVNTIGGVIQPGMNIVEIVPTEGTLLIETKIKPADIAFLKPNQKATVKFSAYDYTIYGGLEARLEQIGADSLTDEKTRDTYYLVTLRTDRNYLGTKDKPLPIIPGMVATVDIVAAKRTILSYLLKPILKAKYTALRER
ncbi:HlyD family type I secretion periplasmic adaptor subunit [Geomonas anaerohicana]|uniref:HlyD family type I secretion periplasmic adaptor subunit n=1 Tax=Geomonas anaerohicana TaxID=2798583 RepID=A0ABS0YJL1_9BACT|nr:HlyD family type I secretion periplasmic adaptor subunit [Geomonas anaerohicana]MBJ6752437.1 HlyD family type I secretion periplasmic adaptor subunit [Geomonas anaerohicana]